MTPGRKFSMTTSTAPMSRRTRSRALGNVEVHRDQALSDVELGKAERAQRDSPPGLVTRGRLELDHVGAQFRKHASAVRARDDAGQIENTGPGEGTPTHPHVDAPWAMSRKGAS